MKPTLQQRLYALLEDSDSVRARLDDYLLSTIIVLNVAAVILETLPAFKPYLWWFALFELFSIVVFTAEYLLRLWVITCHPRFSHPVWGRLRYMMTPLAIIDLLAILPFYIPAVLPDLRFLRLLRLLRIFKLARYSAALRTIGSIFWSKREELIITLFATIFLLIFSSSIVYYVENEAQPEVFSSIPAAMWWGVATVTTVGYGDIYPVTPLGKFFTGLIALLGVGIFALPAGILAGGFAEELQKQRSGSQPEEPCYCPYCGKKIRE